MDQSFLTKHVITRLSKRKSIAHNGEEVHFHSITSQICSRHDYLCSVKSVNLRGIDWPFHGLTRIPNLVQSIMRIPRSSMLQLYPNATSPSFSPAQVCTIIINICQIGVVSCFIIRRSRPLLVTKTFFAAA